MLNIQRDTVKGLNMQKDIIKGLNTQRDIVKGLNICRRRLTEEFTEEINIYRVCSV